jgi:hypothetical protein
VHSPADDLCYGRSCLLAAALMPPARMLLLLLRRSLMTLQA